MTDILVPLSAVAAVSVAMATPLVRTSPVVDVLPIWMQWYARPSGDYTTFTADLPADVQSGAIPQSRIDDAVSRILTKKFELGLFEHPLADRSYASTIGSQAHRDLARGAEVFDNLASGRSPALRVVDPSRPGVAVIPMISPYVYLGGKLMLESAGRSRGDKLSVSISTNNGGT